MNKKINIPLYEGMKVTITVEKDFLIAEYEKEAKKDENLCVIEEYPIGSIFEHKGKYYLVCEPNNKERCGCKGCCFFLGKGACQYKKTCSAFIRKYARSILCQEVKDGDILIKDDMYEIIFGGLNGIDVKYYAVCALADDNNDIVINDVAGNRNFSIPKRDNSCVVIEKLKSNGKDWDAVNKRIIDYVEPLKEGDFCILWQDNKKSSRVSELCDIQLDKKYPYKDNNQYVYKNAVKCESLEQYKEFIKG